VVLDAGDDANASVDDLAAAARARLSAFKVPVCWRVIRAEDVPMTATGKVDQSALRALLGEVAAR
jgi:acyl-CoA synthetase (AMP-forming)/AMP-acid ligase II